MWERIFAAVAASALIFPGVPTDAFGTIVLAFVFRRAAHAAVPATHESTVALVTKT
jgi:UPF0716 family protein affecting phage T7 exclusion